jgi:hypothetical protein
MRVRKRTGRRSRGGNYAYAAFLSQISPISRIHARVARMKTPVNRMQ